MNLDEVFTKNLPYKQAISVLFVLLCAGALLSCQSRLFSYQGARVAQVNLIPLLEDGAHGNHFEAEDVSVDYRYERSGSELLLTGVISYSSALQHSFPTVPDFYIRVFFADGQERVLGYRGIVVSGYGYSTDQMPFREVMTLPSGTAFMAFGYSGEARDSSSGEAVLKSFWFDPTVH